MKACFHIPVRYISVSCACKIISQLHTIVNVLFFHEIGVFDNCPYNFISYLLDYGSHGLLLPYLEAVCSGHAR